MDDEFNDVLGDALDATEEEEEGFDLGDEEGESDKADIHDSDKDEQPSRPAIDAAHDLDAKAREAANVRDQWQAEHDRVEAEFKAAQDAYRKAREAAVNGDGDVSDEMAAHDRVMSVRYSLEKARDSLSQAARYHEYVASQPRLAPAAQAWLEANRHYQADARFKASADKAMAELKAQGYDETHQNFYRKLDERLRTPQRMGKDSRRTPGAPAVHIRGGDPQGPSVTTKEATFLKRIGLDPSDKRVRAQWAESKANTRRVARAQGKM